MTTTQWLERVSPAEVHSTLREHILADGLSYVLDLQRSHGSYLYDARGERELLDLFMCFATCPLGYNHPKLVTPEFREAVLPAAYNKPSNSDLYTPQMAEFVQAFARTVPAPLDRHMFFIEGGALAVENALKAAFDWKVRKNMAAGKGEKGHRVIHFRQAFHGRSGYTLSLTNTADPRKYEHFPRFDWPRISNPTLRFPLDETVLAEVAEAEETALAEIRQALAAHPDEIAALIVEPIQGEGGDGHFRAEFLRALRRLADEEEFLLVYDEVQTGFGTTGKWWCFEHFEGAVPDVFAFGKKSQVCGICAGPRLDEVDSVFKVSSRINSTWGGNLVDMIRCRRYVEIIEEDDLLENATRVGRQLMEGISTLAAARPELISNVRGRGMFVAFDLPDRDARRALLARMAEHGVLGLPSGVRSVRFRPALSLTEAEAAEGLSRLERALRAG